MTHLGSTLLLLTSSQDGSFQRSCTQTKASTPSYLVGKSQELVASTDVVLEVQGASFPAHSAHLACSCKFFDGLLYDSPCKKRKCTEGSAEPRRIVLAPEGSDSVLTPANVELFLQHVYAGSLKLMSLTMEDAEVLLPVADFFAEEALMQRCSQLLSSPERLQKILKPGAVNSEALKRELATAARFKLRPLMAGCLPYLTEDVFVNKTTAALGECADSVLMKVVLQALNASEITMASYPGGYVIPARAFTVGSGAMRPAVSSTWFLNVLTRESWGR